jgi:hypothetical protein
MTRYLVDVASWQDTLSPADVKRAGFDTVNLKISHGLGQLHVHPDISSWISQCWTLGLDVSTFHYLTGDASGESQAEYARSRMLALGLTYGAAHFVDVEAPAGITLPIVRGYLTRMAQLLGRPAGVYTGDWWWKPRGWNVSDLTPFVMSAPNDGYPGVYPGDKSIDWAAGWGGWPSLAVMQYAVAPLSFPDGTRGTINVSKSAVRYASAWNELKGETMAWRLTHGLENFRAQANARWPARDKASDGTIGDAAHQAEVSGHNPDDTAGSTPEWTGDADATAEVRAFDMDSDLREPGTTMQMLVDHLRALPGLNTVIRYMIFNRMMYHERDGFASTTYAGASAHLEHLHLSGAWSNAADENTTFDFKLEEVGQMPITQDDANLIADTLLRRDGIVPNYGSDKDANPFVAPSWALGRASLNNTMLYALRDWYNGFDTKVSGILATLLVLAQSEAAEIPPSAQAVADAVLADLNGQTAEQTAAALVAVLGTERAGQVFAAGTVLAAGQ